MIDDEPDAALPVYAAAPLPLERDPFWTYVDLLLLIGSAFAMLLLFSVPLAVVYAKRPDLLSFPAFAIASQLGLYAAIYLSLRVVFSTRYRRSVFASLQWRRPATPIAVFAVAGVVLGLCLAFLMQVLHIPEAKSPVDLLINSRLTLWIAVLMAAVAAPVFEEALFRGFLQPLLSRTFGTVVGILVTASLFGVLHYKEYSGIWQYAALITFVGVVFGIVRVATKSLIPSTVMHAAFNALSAVSLIATKYPNLK